VAQRRDGRRPRQPNLLRLFLAERRDPGPFYERLADDAAADLTGRLDGRTVLDLGCGPGHYTRALLAAGARVVPLDAFLDELFLPGGPPPGALVGDARRLPLADASIDGVLCSNMLEHTSEPLAVIDELERVVRPGGWMWLSWTNWYSPWGGHEVSPWHYLGGRRAARIYERRTGHPPKNDPGRSLFPLHVGRTVAELRRREDVRVRDVRPRYFPSQRWVVRVPGVREVITWNCLIVLERM
jgi:SAM-dependent methyltransferase